MDTISCATAMVGYVSDSTDCDDTNPLIYPGAPEILNGIDDNCNKLIDEESGIEQNAEINETFTMFPIPATNEIKIKFNSPLSGELFVYDIFGQIIILQQLNSVTSETINISHFTPGNYLIKINDSTGHSSSMKFCKMN